MRLPRESGRRFSWAVFVLGVVVSTRSMAGDGELDRAIEAKQFDAAVKQVGALPMNERDAALARIASAQRQNGDYAGAAKTASTIQEPSNRNASLMGSSGGGGAAADFDSLMNLIRTTVEPDTWIDNGGTSRMEPYPGGIRIDAAGLVSEIEQVPSRTGSRSVPAQTDPNRVADQSLQQRSREAQPDLQAATTNAAAKAQSWRTTSQARSVSLRGLQAHVATRIAAGLPPDEAMRHVAGLTRLYGVVVPPERDDLILVGSVGDLKQHRFHGWCDAGSGRPTLRLEDLAAMAQAVSQGESIGCSIDPTQAGLAAVQQVAADLRSGKIQGAAAQQALAKALGPQNVTLMGMHADAPASLAFVAADRHMKMIALKQAEAPESVRPYFTWVEKMFDEHGLPDGQLLRFWFTGKPIPVATSQDGMAWTWNRTPICLLSEKEMADAMGQRRGAGQDPRAVEFAREMTEHFDALPQVEPVYGRIAGLFELGLGLELGRRGLKEANAWQQAVGLLAAPDGWLMRLPQPPRMVPTLVASHSFRRGRKQHLVTVISGGIELQARALVSASTIQPESRADRLAEQSRRAVDGARQWWWDHATATK